MTAASHVQMKAPFDPDGVSLTIMEACLSNNLKIVDAVFEKLKPYHDEMRNHPRFLDSIMMRALLLGQNRSVVARIVNFCMALLVKKHAASAVGEDEVAKTRVAIQRVETLATRICVFSCLDRSTSNGSMKFNAARFLHLAGRMGVWRNIFPAITWLCRKDTFEAIRDTVIRTIDSSPDGGSSSSAEEEKTKVKIEAAAPRYGADGPSGHGQMQELMDEVIESSLREHNEWQQMFLNDSPYTSLLDAPLSTLIVPGVVNSTHRVAVDTIDIVSRGKEIDSWILNNKNNFQAFGGFMRYLCDDTLVSAVNREKARDLPDSYPRRTTLTPTVQMLTFVDPFDKPEADESKQSRKQTRKLFSTWNIADQEELIPQARTVLHEFVRELTNNTVWLASKRFKTGELEEMLLALVCPDSPFCDYELAKRLSSGLRFVNAVPSAQLLYYTCVATSAQVEQVVSVKRIKKMASFSSIKPRDVNALSEVRETLDDVSQLVDGVPCLIDLLESMSKAFRLNIADRNKAPALIFDRFVHPLVLYIVNKYRDAIDDALFRQSVQYTLVGAKTREELEHTCALIHLFNVTPMINTERLSLFGKVQIEKTAGKETAFVAVRSAKGDRILHSIGCIDPSEPMPSVLARFLFGYVEERTDAIMLSRSLLHRPEVVLCALTHNRVPLHSLLAPLALTFNMYVNFERFIDQRNYAMRSGVPYVLRTMPPMIADLLTRAFMLLNSRRPTAEHIVHYLLSDTLAKTANRELLNGSIKRIAARPEAAVRLIRFLDARTVATTDSPGRDALLVHVNWNVLEILEPAEVFRLLQGKLINPFVFVQQDEYKTVLEKIRPTTNAATIRREIFSKLKRMQRIYPIMEASRNRATADALAKRYAAAAYGARILSSSYGLSKDQLHRMYSKYILT